MQAAQIQFTEKLIAHGAVPAFQFPFSGGRIGTAVDQMDTSILIKVCTEGGACLDTVDLLPYRPSNY